MSEMVVDNAALVFSGKEVATAATNKKAPVSAAGNTWSFVFQGHHLMVTSGTDTAIDGPAGRAREPNRGPPRPCERDGCVVASTRRIG